MLDNVEELKIWQLKQVAKQNDIVPRGQKRRLKEHWVKAIREHQTDRLIGVGAVGCWAKLLCNVIVSDYWGMMMYDIRCFLWR